MADQPDRSLSFQLSWNRASDPDARGSMGVDLHGALRTSIKAASFDVAARPGRQRSGHNGSVEEGFDKQLKGMRWRAGGQCCFVLADSGKIDAQAATRALPHVLHLATLSKGHLAETDLSGFRACILLSDLVDWPSPPERAEALLEACRELAGNGSAVAVLAVFLSAEPHLCDIDHEAAQALHRAVMAAGADSVLFSCPAHPVTQRNLCSAVLATEAWHERVVEAMESAQQKVAKQQEQKWQRHYQIALRKIVWKAPQTVFPHIPHEDKNLNEREDGVGDYEFVRILGSGAFGSVHLAKHPRIGGVAVKVIKKASIKNIFDLVKVERELSILKGVLNHPNILHVHTCLHGNMNIYIIMEFLGDYTLHTYIQLRQLGSARNVQTLPFQEVQSIFGDLLKAVAHCHAAHVCHRDIKFKNMMINSGGRVTLVDFGLAVHIAPGQELFDSCGTVPFAAPEVMTCTTSCGYVGPAADVWSLCVCLVELMCGLGTVEEIISLSPSDVDNFEHISAQCQLLATEYVHQLVLSYCGKDVQGMHRDSLTKAMRGGFRVDPAERLSAAAIGTLEAFSAHAGPLPPAPSFFQGKEGDDGGEASPRDSLNEEPMNHRPSFFLAPDRVQQRLGTFETASVRPRSRKEAPLLERIGGPNTVRKVVNTVYDWLLQRPEFARFFMANPLKMGRIRAGIASFLSVMFTSPETCDLEMVAQVHWNLNVSDQLFSGFTDALVEAFRTWGGRGEMALELSQVLERLRSSITAGHRTKLASAQTDRSPQEVAFLIASLDSSPEEFSRAIEDALAQDARLEVQRGALPPKEHLQRFARFMWQGSLDSAIEVVFRSEESEMWMDHGSVYLFSDNVRQALGELGMAAEDCQDIALLLEHAGELAVTKSRNAQQRHQPSTASQGQDVAWFKKTVLDLCRADSYLQYFAEMPRMERCLESIYWYVMGGMTGELAGRLRAVHNHLHFTDARYTALLVQIDKVLRTMFPWPAYPASLCNGAIRSLEALRTEVLCGSTLRNSRLAMIDGSSLFPTSGEQVRLKVAKRARSGMVMAAMQRAAGVLFDRISQDPRVAVFFRNTDPACKGRKAKYLGCALSGVTPPLLESCPTYSPPSTAASRTSTVSTTSNSGLKDVHRRWRITDYHFDCFLEHVHQSLESEDPEASDLALAQLEQLRPQVVMETPHRCPVTGLSGSRSSGKNACPFRRAAPSDAPILEQLGGQEMLEQITRGMERGLGSCRVLARFHETGKKLPCHAAIVKQLSTAVSQSADAADLAALEHRLQESHRHLGLLPEHVELIVECFNRSMVAQILPPELAEQLSTTFSSLAKGLVPRQPQVTGKEEDIEPRPSDWGSLKGCMEELGGEEGLGRLIEVWYSNISQQPMLSVFFTGDRGKLMMFQTRFWSEVLREGLSPDGRRQMQIIKIHQHLRISHSHFDNFVQCLTRACEALDLSMGSTSALRAAVECFRQQIVSERSR